MRVSASHTSLRRFEAAKPKPEKAKALRADHPAVLEGRPLFPSSVVNAAEAGRLLVSGHNNPKLGKTVEKGPLKGFPIYHLTLPERTTCPASCYLYDACFGNAMPFARRHAPGPELEQRLLRDVAAVAMRHPTGFLVRLHALGDFYSVGYVRTWGRLMARHPMLHVFGYSACQPDAEDAEEQAIGAEVAYLRLLYGTRFYIRWSHAEARTGGATTINYTPRTARVAEGIVCPAQREATMCCATCGLCWNPETYFDTIVFIRHGMVPRGAGRRSDG